LELHNILWDSPAEAKINDYKKPAGELVLLPLTVEDNNGKKNGATSF